MVVSAELPPKWCNPSAYFHIAQWGARLAAYVQLNSMIPGWAGFISGPWARQGRIQLYCRVLKQIYELHNM